ncbi:MAG: hypothetical protein LBK73_12185 [Treponema sp.]|jgi:predicted RNA-binding Zn-ribbon protein involved in translation (DUF1610 family)|nr:hypothetical protein [Treponema sp.]
MRDDLESVVYCPVCGNEISIGLEKLSSGGLMDIFLGEDGKQNHYSSETKCPSCGAGVMATLTVTGMKLEAGG